MSQLPPPKATPPGSVATPLGDSARWALPLDIAELARHIAWCEAAAPTSKSKGDRLEQLTIWLFSHIPGFRVMKSNTFSEDGASEVDVAIWNEGRDEGLPSFGSTILVECKNRNRALRSQDVAWFDWKLRLGAIRYGILVASQGITGEMVNRNAASSIVSHANVDKRTILVLTMDDLGGISSTMDLRDLLIEKRMNVALLAPF